ncbi:MAG: TadE family protein [Elusimicrobiota bacterium]
MTKQSNIKKLFTIHYSLFTPPLRAGAGFTASKGQALVENILFLPILCIIISMIVWFSRILITRQQLVTAARYGTDMIVYTKMDASEIRQEIKNYLTDKNIEGRRLNPAKLPDDKIKIIGIENRFSKINETNAIRVDLITNKNTSAVEVYYEFGVPTIFSAWASYISGGALPEKIYVSGRSEVLAGTGCKGDNHP